MTPTPSTPGSSFPRRLVGCLFKAPLGCFSFLLGAGIVLVLFLPPALGKLLARATESTFERNHHGELEVSGAWFGSLYGEQRVESFVLRDPEGDEILHGSFRAPSLMPILEEEATDWGPVSLTLANVALRRDAEGVTNWTRALARREEPAAPERRGSMRVDLGDMRSIGLEVVVERLTYGDAALRSLVVSDLRCAGTLEHEAGGRVRISASGTGTFAEQGEPFGMAFSCPDVERLWAGTAEWRFSFECGRAPAATVLAFFPGLAGLEEGLGDPVDGFRFEVRHAPDGTRRVENLVVDGRDIEVALQGSLPHEGHALVAGPEDVSRLRFARRSALGRSLLAGAIPLAQGVASEAAEGHAELVLADYELQLDGDLGSSRARCELNADDLELHFLPDVERRLHLIDRLSGPAVTAFRLEDGYLRYEDFPLPLKTGSAAVSGSFDLDGRTYALVLRLPDMRAFEVRGTKDAPAVEPVDGR